MPAIVMPTMPPTMAWVVETGIDAKVASRRKPDAPTSAPTMPIPYTVIRWLEPGECECRSPGFLGVQISMN